MDSTYSSGQPESDVNGGLASGKENMLGRAIFKGLDMLCPVSTATALAIAEQPELRAYKLGKQKCSYNQVELVIKDLGAAKVAELKVSEAIETCVGPEIDERLRESCLKFNVRFVNNNRMHLYIYVVYATPYGAPRTDKNSVKYLWIPVTRSKCRKGCKGPVIRGLQRFGRMPRRSATTLDGEDSWKEPRHLYIAIDEASTHVCPRHETSKFRLLVAAYDDKNQLLGTTVSSSIRVLANNDAPLGAASFKLHCHIKGGWDTDTVESPSRNTNYNGLAFERSGLNIRSPLQDILQNSSPPKSYKSTTIDETAKQVEIASLVLGPVHINQLTNEKILDHEFLSGGKLRRAVADEVVLYPKVDKDHSLTDLCHRLFKSCVAKQEHGQATITLRGLANTLGSRRRRILEILNVLESIQVVHHQGKERYTWIGSCQIARTLIKLKVNMSAVREPADIGRSFLSPIRKGKLKTALTRPIEDLRTEANNPMRTLSKRFIQLFLVHEKGRSVAWDQILECIVDGHGHDPETMRAKTRRVGEIARIFSALHLIRKAVNCNQRLQSGLVYEWLGTQGVAEYLLNVNDVAHAGSASLIKKVGGRSTRAQEVGVKSPTRQEKRGPGGIRERSACDHGLTMLDDVNQHLQPRSKQAPVPGSNLSQFNFKDERPALSRNLKRKFTGVDEQVPFSENLTSIEKKGGKRLDIPQNQHPRPGSLSNHILASCGEFSLSSAYRLCQSTIAGHIRGELSSQLKATISHQLSRFPPWKIQVASISSGKTSTAPQENYLFQPSAPQEISPKEASEIDRDSCDREILNYPSSSERVHTSGFASPDKTDESSTTIERTKDDNLTLRGSPPATTENGILEILDGCVKRHEQDRLVLEPCDRDRHEPEPVTDKCGSLVALEEEASFQPVKQIRSDDHTSVVSCNAAHQFPYKKRKFDVTSFTSFAESNDCDHSRDVESQSSPSQSEHVKLAEEHQENTPSTFDPLFHLLCFYSPTRIFELQSQNPAFLFTYIKDSRALYHKWCAQGVRQTLIRPVASVGKISATQSGPAFSVSPSSIGQCQHNLFL